MQTSREVLLVILCGALAGCSVPGKQDLVEKGYAETVVVQLDHKRLAECVTRTLDNEPPYRWGELQTPVTRSIPSADGNSIDLQGSYPLSPTILLWSTRPGNTAGMKVEEARLL